MMLVIANLAFLAVLSGQPSEETFYDTTWMTDSCDFNNGFGNALSGRAVLGDLYDLRLADDFALPRAAVIEDATADYLSFCTTLCEQLLVRVYADHNGSPQEPPLYEQWVADFEFEDLSNWPQCGWQFCITRFTARGLSLELPAGRYWMCMQPVDMSENGDWYYQTAISEYEGPQDATLGFGASAHVRDGDLGKGGWGHQDWRSTQEHDLGHATSAMRLTGRWATVCDRIESLSAVCSGGRLRVEVESSLPEDKKLTVFNGPQHRRMTIRKDGRGRVHFDGQVADGEVTIESCPEWTQFFDCP
ncbi:MAG: hypothetical protein IT449_05020 [Phycisphaerales bacterium]|nr:hypothetical protein [Phycisphaerales bacterium]